MKENSVARAEQYTETLFKDLESGQMFTYKYPNSGANVYLKTDSREGCAVLLKNGVFYPIRPDAGVTPLKKGEPVTITQG